MKSFPEEVFRSYDIRGTLDQLSLELAHKVGASLVHITKAKTVLVGHDMRDSSPRLVQAAIQGIISQGADVVDMGLCSTPTFKFAISSFSEHEAGLMVTASHSPAEYNGIKLTNHTGYPVTGEDIKEAVLNKELPVVDKLGQITKRDFLEDYIDKLIKLAELPSLKGLKVVLDAGNAMSGLVLPKLFARLDCEVVPLYFDLDGNFPNHEANPAKEETLADLKKKVIEVKADFGAGFDGDGDRVCFIDEKGQYIRSDLILALLATEYLKQRPGGKILISPSMSWTTKEAIEAAGGEAVLEKVGYTYVIKKLREVEGAMGGEVSGHFYFDVFNNLDSSEFALLLVIRVLVQEAKSLSEVMASYIKYHSLSEINFEVADQQAVLKKLEELYRPVAKEYNDLDGIRADFENWWFSIRPSNNDPVVRLNIEATSKELFEEKKQEIIEVIKNT